MLEFKIIVLSVMVNFIGIEYNNEWLNLLFL